MKHLKIAIYVLFQARLHECVQYVNYHPNKIRKNIALYKKSKDCLVRLSQKKIRAYISEKSFVST